MELRAGLAVTRHVRLVEPLGEGGMGSVWVADHVTLGTQVAVKFIAEGPDRLDRVERFRREAALAAKIKNAHAVRIHDHGFLDDDTPYIVMEMLAGRTLRALLDERVLSPDDVAVMVAQVAEVLSEAHALGIVHRDIKPANLFVCREDPLGIKVLDFGIAKQSTASSDDVTRTGAWLGTPKYMSPELIESAKDATPQADLWALGVVAYEALVGRAPFSGETVGALCIAISKAKHEPPSRAADVPPRLDRWFSRALAPRSEERFDDALGMADALAQALVAPTDPGEASPPSRRSSRRGRRGTRFPLVVGVGALAAVGAYVALASDDEPVLAAAPIFRADDLQPVVKSPVPKPATTSIATTSTTAEPEASSSAGVTPPAPPTPTARPAAKPATRDEECLAYDARAKKWIYTCD